MARVCDVEPFRYQATPQIELAGASANQINEQALEDYLSRLKEAICDDIVALETGSDVNLSFLQLNDTPDSYSGQANKIVTVAPTEDGLVFSTPSAALADLAQYVGLWHAAPSQGSNFGFAATETGTTTVTDPDVAPTNLIQGAKRTVKSTGAGAGSTANSRGAGGFVVRMGDGTNLGGFRLRWLFGNATTVAQQASFVGLLTTGAAIGNVNPSTLTDIVAFAYDQAGTTWTAMHNDGAGTATSTSFGAGFPVNTTTLYEGIIECQPGSQDVTFTLINKATGATGVIVATTNTPQVTSRFVPQIWVGNRTTAAIASIVHVFMSLEALQL